MGEASGDLWQVVSHGAKGFGFDEAAQRNAMWGGLAVIGFLVLFVPYNRRTRRAVESLMRRKPRGAGALARVIPAGFFNRSGALSPPVLRRLARAQREGAEAAGRARRPSPTHPLAPWTPGPFRFAARVLMLVMLFQGAVFFMPVQTQAQVVSCDETFYPLTDNLGSVNILTDSGGNVVLTQHFLPFGEDFEDPKPAVSTCNNSEPWPYGFTGQHHDAETSLIYFHARYYNPAIGHFMSPDSVVPNPNDTYSYDRYAYCRNNPVNLTDPTGHVFGFDDIFLMAVIIGTAVGAYEAACNGSNVLIGALQGYFSAELSTMFGVTGAMAWAAWQSQIYGGNVLRAALIAGASTIVGAYAGAAASSIASSLGSSAMQGFLNVIASGLVGGATSSAMGGDFWQGFTSAAVVAGVSLAANEIAGEIEANSSKDETNPGVAADAEKNPTTIKRGDARSEYIDPAAVQPISECVETANSMVEAGDPAEFGIIGIRDASSGELRTVSGWGTETSAPSRDTLIAKAFREGKMTYTDKVEFYAHYHPYKVGSPIPGTSLRTVEGPSGYPIGDTEVYHRWTADPKAAPLGGTNYYTITRAGNVYRYNPY